MPETVTVHLAPDQVTYGFYTVAGSTLTMTDCDGKPMEISGLNFEHVLRPNDNPEAIAAVLTKRIRSMLRGHIVEGFDRELSYSGAVA